MVHTFLYARRLDPYIRKFVRPYWPFSPWVFYRPLAYRQHSLPPDCFRPPLAAATVALSRCRGASYTGFAADARPPRAGVSGRYPVIPPVKLPVIQTTVFCCLSADFLPPANESHSPRIRPRLWLLPGYWS